jgi:hypothetical protein
LGRSILEKAFSTETTFACGALVMMAAKKRVGEGEPHPLFLLQYIAERGEDMGQSVGIYRGQATEFKIHGLYSLPTASSPLL